MDLPPALITAIQQRKLLVLAGAGISMLPPSSLPSWYQFNEILLETAKSVALTSESLTPEARTAIAGLSFGRGAPQSSLVSQRVLSETMYSYFLGPRYFSIVRVLNSDRTNANHHALAELAKSTVIRAIVTTNFDTLIERACNDAGVPLTVISTSSKKATESTTQCTLYKIHGSVTNTSSLIDTVGQKIRGLPLQTRALLKNLFAFYHVLVVGYSGDDLEFAPDYLALSVLEEGGPGMTWLTRYGSTLHQLAREAVHRAGKRGAIIEGSLPEFFRLLGVRVEAESMLTEDGVRSAAIDRARDWATTVLQSVGPLSATGFCLKVLFESGNISAATHLRKALVEQVEAQGDNLPSRETPVLRVLADTADLESAAGRELWSRKEVESLERELELWRSKSRIAKMQLATSDPISPPLDSFGIYPFDQPLTPESWIAVDRVVVEDLQRLQSGAWTNLARYYLTVGRHTETQRALGRSLYFADLSADIVALSAVYAHQGFLLATVMTDADHAVNRLAMAEATALAAGYLPAANNAALVRVQTLIRLGEYDSALSIVARVRGRADLQHGMAVATEIIRLQGTIEARRGKVAEAGESFDRALTIASPNAPLASIMRCTIIAELHFVEGRRSNLIEHCETLLRSMSDGIVPSDGSFPGVFDRIDVIRWRNRLQQERPSGKPDFIGLRTAVDEESAYRRELLNAEFAGDHQKVASCLIALAEAKFNAGQIMRMSDLAAAATSAAQRSGNRKLQLISDFTAASALFFLADFETARTKLQPLLEDEILDDVDRHGQARAFLEMINENRTPKVIPKGAVHLARFLDGRMPSPESPGQLEQIATEVRDAGNYPVARAIVFQAMAIHRDSHDDLSMARCYESLSELAELENEAERSRDLRAKAANLRSGDPL